MAIDLAAHPEKLAAIKHKLAENRLTTPLFDTKLFTKHIEAAYTNVRALSGWVGARSNYYLGLKSGITPTHHEQDPGSRNDRSGPRFLDHEA